MRTSRFKPQDADHPWPSDSSESRGIMSATHHPIRSPSLLRLSVRSPGHMRVRPYPVEPHGMEVSRRDFPDSDAMGLHPISPDLATNGAWSTTSLVTSAAGRLVPSFDLLRDRLIQHRQLVVERTDVILQLMDLITHDRTADDEDHRKDCDQGPH
jgi:hypothetical protein